MPPRELIQKLIHMSEVGAGSRYLRFLVLGLAVVGLALVFPEVRPICPPRFSVRFLQRAWHLPRPCFSRCIARSARCGGWRGPAERQACANAGRQIRGLASPDPP